jgi:hypothetical protein
MLVIKAYYFSDYIIKVQGDVPRASKHGISLIRLVYK